MSAQAPRVTRRRTKAISATDILFQNGLGPLMLAERIKRAMGRVAAHKNVRLVNVPASKKGPFNGVRLEIEGRTFEIEIKEVKR